MRRRLLLIGIILGGLSLLFSGCGTGPGSPGSKGFEDVGAYIDVISESHSDPAGDQGDVWQMDLSATLCDPGPPPEYEEWGDDLAVLEFEATSYDPNFPAGNIYIQRYIVEFRPQNFEFGLPPARRYDLTTYIRIEPDVGTTTATLLVLKFGDKTDIADAIDDGLFSPGGEGLLYDMKITFIGQDIYGNDFSFPWRRTVELWHYNNC